MTSQAHLNTARSLLDNSSNSIDAEIDRVVFQHIMSALDGIQSRLAAEQGQPYVALLFARLSVKGYFQAWSVLERRCRRQIQNVDFDQDMSINSLSDTLQKSSLSARIPSPRDSQQDIVFRSVPFWTLTPRLVNALLNLSAQFAQAGLFLDAEHYLQEAEKVAMSARAPRLLGQCQAIKAEQSAFSGDIERSREARHQALNHLSTKDMPADYQAATNLLKIIGASISSRDSRSVQSLLNQADRMIDTLADGAYLSDILCNPPKVEAIQMKMDALTLDRPGSKSITDARPGSKESRSRSRPLRREIEASSTKSHSTSTEKSEKPFLKLKGKWEYYRVLHEVAVDNIGEAEKLLGNLTGDETHQPQHKFAHLILRSEIKLLLGLQALATHPVYNIVPESTVCHPSVSPSANTDGSKIFPGKQSRIQKQGVSKSAKKPRETPKPIETLFSDCLTAIRTDIASIVQAVQNHLSTQMICHMLHVLSRSLMFLTILPVASAGGPPSSILMSWVTGEVVSE